VAEPVDARDLKSLTE